MAMRKMYLAAKDLIAERMKRSGIYAQTLATILDGFSPQRNADLVPEAEVRDKLALKEAGKSARLRWNERRASSSGTTGEPFIFPQPISALQFEQAFIDWMWSRVGFQAESRIAVLRGTIVPGGHVSLGRRLLMSGRDWGEAAIAGKAEALRSFDPEYIHCYPSLLDRFLRNVVSLGLPLPSGVKGVLAGSESCTVEHESLFFELLGCPTISWYGQSEQVVLAVKEREGEFAVLPGYSDVAFCRRGDGIEILGKSRANPFFNVNWYGTGDFCESFRFGRSEALQVDTVLISGLQGRAPKRVTLSNGQYVPFNHLIFGLHSSAWSAIERYCFVQADVGVVRLVYARVPGAQELTSALVRELRDRMPDGLAMEAIEDPRLREIDRSKWQYFFSNEEEFQRYLSSDLRCLASREAG